MALFGTALGGMAEGVKIGTDVGYKWHRIGIENDINARAWLEEERTATKFGNEQQDRSESRSADTMAAEVVTGGTSGLRTSSAPAKKAATAPARKGALPPPMMLGGEPSADRSAAIDTQPRGPNTGVAYPVQPAVKAGGKAVTPADGDTVNITSAPAEPVTPAGGVPATKEAIGTGQALSGEPVAPTKGKDVAADVTGRTAPGGDVSNDLADSVAAAGVPLPFMTVAQAKEVWKANPISGRKYYEKAVADQRQMWKDKLESAEKQDSLRTGYSNRLTAQQARRVQEVNLSKTALEAKYEIASQSAFEGAAIASRLDPDAPILAQRGAAMDATVRLADAWTALRRDEAVDVAETDKGLLIRFQDKATGKVKRLIPINDVADLNKAAGEIGAVSANITNIQKWNGARVLDETQQIILEHARVKGGNALDSEKQTAEVRATHKELREMLSQPDALLRLDDINKKVGWLTAFAREDVEYEKMVRDPKDPDGKPMKIKGNVLEDAVNSLIGNTPVTYFDKTQGKDVSAKPMQIVGHQISNAMASMKEAAEKKVDMPLEEILPVIQADLLAKGMPHELIPQYMHFTKVKLQEFKSAITSDKAAAIATPGADTGALKYKPQTEEVYKHINSALKSYTNR